MDTPRPWIDGGRRPHGVDGETLPPASAPRMSSAEARSDMEAEMVAVSERMNKAMKLLPDNLKWNGQHDTYDAFIEHTLLTALITENNVPE